MVQTVVCIAGWLRGDNPNKHTKFGTGRRIQGVHVEDNLDVDRAGVDLDKHSALLVDIPGPFLGLGRVEALEPIHP